MKELLLGIIDFRRRLRPSLLSTFQKIATTQKPNSLFIACADSRVVPNLFASTNPGELFSIRNVGNMIPPPNEQGMSGADESEMAAVEFSIDVLEVRNIIVCGHSECGAMKAIINSADTTHEIPKQIPVSATTPHLNSWLRHGFPALQKYHQLPQSSPDFFNGNARVPSIIDSSLPPHDQLSQVNVLQQVEHICKYQKVREKVHSGEILIHAWWFDIANANVFSFSDRKRKFVLIDDTKAEEMLERLGELGSLQDIAAKYQTNPTTKTHFQNPSWTDPILRTSSSSSADVITGENSDHNNTIPSATNQNSANKNEAEDHATCCTHTPTKNP